MTLLLLAVMMSAPPTDPSASGTPLAQFENYLAEYSKIHDAAVAEVGGMVPTQSSANLVQQRASLAEAIRSRRESAAQGDLFTAGIAAEFRRLIATNLKHRRTRIRGSLNSGELVVAQLKVNQSYPEGMPLQTMPPTLLMAFPKLPRGLEYRLVGTTLLLRDESANVIIDLLPNAIAMQ